MYKINSFVLFLVLTVAVCAFLIRAYAALSDFLYGDETGLLSFPLAVVLPFSALLFLASRRAINSPEGVLMQLGTMLLILLIIALPALSLHLALGLPVVFLAVELFEQRMPEKIRTAVKSKLIA